MGSECNNGKRRLHNALSLDNPLQRETWLILSQTKNKTSAVCEAVCSYKSKKVWKTPCEQSFKRN